MRAATAAFLAAGVALLAGCGSGEPGAKTTSALPKDTITAAPPSDERPYTGPESGDRSAGRPAAALTAADRASFAKLASELPGEEGLAVSGVGRGREPWVAGTVRSGAAWSTAKVPVAMAALDAGVGSREDAAAAITVSDNAAAERLWSALGSGPSAAAAADRVLRAAGDGRTKTESRRLRSEFTAFGQTAWALADQARFVAGMECAPAGPEVLALMAGIDSSQRWGLGAQGRPARFKGGWGPGMTPGAADGWLERQMGVLRVGGRPVVVAMATTAGGHEAGTQALTSIAGWVASHVDVSSLPREATCSGS